MLPKLWLLIEGFVEKSLFLLQHTLLVKNWGMVADLEGLEGGFSEVLAFLFLVLVRIIRETLHILQVSVRCFFQHCNFLI